MTKPQKQNKTPDCCTTEGGMSCCRVEAFVSVDERGQMVLPKDIREKANINAGDKLTLVTCEVDGKVKVISLIRSEEFGKMVKNFLGPMMGEILNSDNKK